MEIFLFLLLAPIIINGFLFHLISKRYKFANPIALIMVFLSFVGTAMLLLILLTDSLDEYYKNK